MFGKSNRHNIINNKRRNLMVLLNNAILVGLIVKSAKFEEASSREFTPSSE
jgi:hypothetical protein